MSSPPGSPSNPGLDSAPLAGSEAHGTKRARDLPSAEKPSDQASVSPAGPHSPKPDPPADSLPPVVKDSQDPNESAISPLAKKGRHKIVPGESADNAHLSPTHSREHPSSTPGGSDQDDSKSRTATPEAHEVKSVRKKVEGMGVEAELEQPSKASVTPQHTIEEVGGAGENHVSSPNVPLSALSPSSSLPSDQNPAPGGNQGSHASQSQLPSSWAAYATVTSPFKAFAPSATTCFFSGPSSTSSLSTSASTVSQPLARAFASPGGSPGKAAGGQRPPPNSTSATSTLGSSSPHFPCGPDFFLKGKRNTPLGGTVPEKELQSSGQHKKLKVPHSSDPEPASSALEAHSSVTTQSLKSSALEKLNNDPSLQIPSHTSPSLHLPPPGSTASSVCAVNGDTDGRSSPAHSTVSALSSFPRNVTSGPSPIGFSAFASPIGFAGTAGTNKAVSSSVFDQNLNTDVASKTACSTGARDGWGHPSNEFGKPSGSSSDVGQEAKLEGFLAKEVITGEEGEDLIKSVRCKVFTLGEDGSWHERGSGALRLLCTREKPYRYRLILRADAVLRLLVNVSIFKGFSCRPSQDKFLSFASTAFLKETPFNEVESAQEGESRSQFQQYLCRFAKPEARQEMMDCIQECLDELESRPAKEASTTERLSPPILRGAELV